VAVDLDEFRLVRMLGHGGMGAVYLGYDTVLERDVAIKLLRNRADDEARLRFLTEARAIARLDHPNVIAIFRASTTRAGHPYLVQELVRGESLDRIALPVAPERALAIGLGIARGLAAAHRRGILHRDVKPANVMLDHDGTPKLLDFGVAKLTGGQSPRAAAAQAVVVLPLEPAGSRAAETLDPTPAPTPAPDATPDPGPEATPAPASSGTAAAHATTQVDSSPATLAGAIIGTPRYMAPEIWRGEPATARSDLYSLGALLYELATGRPPYAEADRAALEAAVVAGPPARPIAELAPAIDPELAEIIGACLARDPAARPESADEVAHRIERILLGAPPVPDGDPYPGLAPFADPYSAVFFGRGTDISTVVDRLRSAPLVVVAGDSGIGKSSLCRAGVLPAVASGGLGDRRTWRTRTVQVGRRAAATLRDALGLTSDPADPELGLDELVRATGVSAETGLVIFLDQLEELVTLNDPEEAARAAAIIASLARGVPGVKLLVAVRGDFLTRVAALPALGAVMARSLHLLGPLSPADARDAVVGPARAKGVRFETEALVDALASSITDQPGALPLLSFALAELWQRRDPERAVIPAAALDAIGGVAGGLARHADAVVGALSDAERAWARRIALLLVTRDDTRAERDRSELCPEEDPAAAGALEAMIRGRLVVARNTVNGAPVYELAHDSLITAWATLQAWRDDIAGQRGLRTRLAAAADEWRRLGRRKDALWNRAQLAEAARLDELSDGDRAFLAASRAAARRRRFAAVGLAASLPAVAIATGLVLQQRSLAARDREVAAHLAEAERHLGAARAARAATDRDRREAFRWFDAQSDDRADPIWLAARTQLATARGEYAAAARELEVALLIDSARNDVRTRMAAALFDQASLAELAGDRDATRELVARLAVLDPDGAFTARWYEPASLAIDAPGAVQITVREYIARDGRLALDTPVASAKARRLGASLPQGSYAIELTGGDGLVVQSPVVVARGEALRLDVPLPRAGDVPPGMVYIPAGRFLTGDASGHEGYRRTFLSAAPLHPVTTGAYLIATHEVTFGDWMRYLRALPEAERERRRPEGSTPNGATLSLGGGHRPGQPFTLTIQVTVAALVAQEGEPLVYPDRTRRKAIRWENAPVSGISLEDARAYLAWLDAPERVPRARLCSEREWERAARGADGRTWAHGDRLEPDDANFDVTYGRKDGAWGPDEVGVHPASNSPFGLADTAGNAWEWVEPTTTEADEPAVLRGGGWYQGAASAEAANREFNSPKARQTWYGLRICVTPR
jgi:serine/threonine protein kinase/formylglycine-generating enzyme required for sulfatase activity